MPLGVFARRSSLLLGLVLAATVAGCAADEGPPDPDAATAGLVVLSSDGGSGRLRRFGEDGAAAEIGAIDGPAEWLSVNLRGDVAVTLADGRVIVAERLATGEASSWTEERPTGLDGRPLGPVRFATWAPAGDRLAALADVAGGGPGGVVVHAPATDGTFVVDVGDQAGAAPIAAPPTWLDDDTLGVVVGNAGDRPRLVAVDVSDGTASPTTHQVTALDVSADGSTIARVVSGVGLLEVWPAEAWRAGAESDADATTIQPPAGMPGAPAAFSLDRGGDRLAVVWTADGRSPAITVHARSGRWSTAASPEVAAGATLVRVDWAP